MGDKPKSMHFTAGEDWTEGILLRSGAGWLHICSYLNIVILKTLLPCFSFNINRRIFEGRSCVPGFILHWEPEGSISSIPPGPLKVGLIGTGWYGKSDLCRLIQVVPTEVLALCDVDKNMLKGAADLISKDNLLERPRLYMETTERCCKIISLMSYWSVLGPLACTADR